MSNDPLHPYIPNGTGKQPTYRITDLTNPNLKPWAKEQMKKDNDDAPRQEAIKTVGPDHALFALRNLNP